MVNAQIWWFLDDEREPVAKNNIIWVIFRDGESLISMLDMVGLPDGISFDHDLGEDRMSGHDVAKEILARVVDQQLVVPVEFEFDVHSQNPIGANNIRNTMNDIHKAQYFINGG